MSTRWIEMMIAKFIVPFLILISITVDTHGQILPWRGRTERSTPRTASSGRYCNNPNCAMCNRLFGLMPGYAYVNGKITYVGRQTNKPTEPPPKMMAFDATPQPIVDVMLILAKLTSDDILLDPGCGDGRFLITSAQRYGCRAIGIEIDPKTANIAEEAVRNAGVDKRVLIIRGDATKHQLGIATVIVCYLYPNTINDVVQNAPGARTIVSYQHPIQGVDNKKLNLSFDGQKHDIYFWSKE